MLADFELEALQANPEAFGSTFDFENTSAAELVF
jgi:hypothetical protein